MPNQYSSILQVLVPSLPLLHVLFDPLRLSQQIRDMVLIRLDESRQQFQVLTEFLSEFQMLLIAPGLTERIELPRNGTEAGLQVIVKFSQHPRKATQFRGINDGL